MLKCFWLAIIPIIIMLSIINASLVGWYVCTAVPVHYTTVNYDILLL